MSPKEEATAVQLLVRWLEQVASPAPPEPLPEWSRKLQQLEDDTRAFIAHEDPDA
jgi:hypothetical protein